MNFIKLVSIRNFSSSRNIPRVCIVGAGPAGFYAAMHITKNLPAVNVDIIEKLPVPFGLIRYGVAPDHPEVKNVINQFTKVAQQPNVNFYGNVTLGKDIRISQLRQHYDAVLLTYGAEEDKTLGIENEEADNIVAARRFVGWYNGLPSDKDLKIDLSGDTAAILGQGNVALDVARILLTPINELKSTDITDHALNALAESKIKEVYLIGRRGPLQVAFTIKELREQLKLSNCQTVWRNQDFEGVENMINDLPRPRKRLTELMLKSLNEYKSIPIHNDNKLFKPIFFRAPKKILVNSHKKITGIDLICNELQGNKLEEQKCVATANTEILNCSLAFRSIGYKCVKADDEIVFNSNGLVENSKGIVDNNSNTLAKLYVAGWLGTGPIGVILHTMGNAFQVAKVMCDDLKNKDCFTDKGGFEEIKKNYIKNSSPIVNWEGWERIDKYEIEQGKLRNKPREKGTGEL
ncbi:NADPH:adrenodoxin oxidoreductase, mitochondrial isoform X2 [Galleria mellonella]|uniref:NADPH:adrenodoxin oxidoreductase, mitochondrial n=1 Tax=Galleria mellonella TaxID=7137 RepID=A0A6J1X3C2_GALME|nr:NADPH:adrenodoxin oxidoreductase, mitochondrial isoform X2 [Galleria mellonella]